MGHSDTIMEAVEIKSRQLIATASRDNNVILWNFHEQKEEQRLDTRHHSKGIRDIDYTHSGSGIIVTVGYEMYINVWNPEISTV